MSPGRFDHLRERLLRAGIAPRHVRRYVTELRDHFDDLVQEGAANGLASDAAERAAHARIGSDDALSAVMLARPDLRSLTARIPWVIFGLGPALLLAVAIVAAVALEGAFLYLHLGFVHWSGAVVPATPPAWVKFLAFAWNWIATYGAPLLIAALLWLLGTRQRVSTSWIALGLATISVVGGFHEIGVNWTTAPAQRSELYVSFALAPPFPQEMIVAGAFRAAMNVALVAGFCWTWLRFNRRASSAQSVRS